jgi:phosphate transport system substrate-binding protein
MRVVFAVTVLLNPQSAFSGKVVPSSTYAATLIDFLLDLEPLAIVVNRANPVDGLSSSELREIFLGDRLHWANGWRITPVMRESGMPERNAVLHNVCRMTEKEFKYHYIHGLYTGSILISPKTLSSSSGVRKFILNVPGSIGYLRVSEVDESLKVLSIDERFPSDTSYKLRVPLDPEGTR